MPCRYMTLSTTERKLAVIAAIAFRGEDFVGSNFLAVGVKIRKQMAEATASAKTTPIPIRQWYHSPIGAETTRPRSPPKTVPAMNVPADGPLLSYGLLHSDTPWPALVHHQGPCPRTHETAESSRKSAPPWPLYRISRR